MWCYVYLPRTERVVGEMNSEQMHDIKCCHIHGALRCVGDEEVLKEELSPGRGQVLSLH